MLPTLYALIFISIGAVMLIFWLSLPQDPQEGRFLRLSTLLLLFWLVASAMWGSTFYVLRIAGLFDITIERVLFIALLSTLVMGLFTGKVVFKKNFAIEFCMLLFVVICLISMLQHGFMSPLPEFYPSPWFLFISGYLFPFIVFIFAKNFLIGERDQQAVFHALFYLGTYLAIISYFEFFGLRQYVFPRYINDPAIWLHLDRARGPFLNSAVNGVAITFGFACGVHLLPRKPPLTKVVYSSLLLLCFPALFFTQTRASYLGFLIALIGFLLLYRTSLPKWKAFALPLTLVLILAMTQTPRLLTSERKTGGVLQGKEVAIRLQLIQKAFGIFRDRPLVGIGLAQFLPFSATAHQRLGLFSEGAQDTTQHNHLLGLLVEIGLVGFSAYLFIYILIFKRFFRLLKKIPETGFMGVNFLVTGAIIWAVYLNNNLFAEPSYFLFLNAVPFLIAGMVDGIYNRYALV